MKHIFIFLSLLLFLACSNNDESKDPFVASFDEETFHLENNIHLNTYYFIILEKHLPYTDWVASISGQHVNPFSKKDYNPLTTEEGNYIVYYWYDADDTDNDGYAENVKSILIER